MPSPMKTYTYTTILVLGLTLSGLSWASNKTICKNGSVERHIEVVATDAEKGAPCEVQYTRDGETKTLWTAQNDANFCKEKAAGLAQKLKDSGWNCDGSEDVAVETKADEAPVSTVAPKAGKESKKTHKKGYDKAKKKACDKENCDKVECACHAKKAKSEAGEKVGEAKTEVKAQDKRAKAKAEREAKKAEKKAKREAKKAERDAKKLQNKASEKVEEAKEEVTE